MHGEKVEEVEELRLDLADVKEMYKAQVKYRIMHLHFTCDLHSRFCFWHNFQ